MSYQAGHFHQFYNTTPGGSGGGSYVYIGSTRDGFYLHYPQHTQPVINDAFGEGMADNIQQGADCTLTLTFIEYGLFSQTLASSTGAFGNANLNVGKTGSTLYGSLVLVPVAGTPWATLLGAGNCYIFPICGLTDDFEVLLASKLAEGPANFRALPSLNESDVNQFFTITTTPSLPSYPDYPH